MLFTAILILNVLLTEAKAKVPCACPLPPECKTFCFNETTANRRHKLQRREVDTDELEEIIDERKCNSDSLQKVMQQNMAGRTAKEAKTKIMRAAETLLGGHFNVICANGDFSYITTTRLYCLHTLGNINCYAFLTEIPRSNFQ